MRRNAERNRNVILFAVIIIFGSGLAWTFVLSPVFFPPCVVEPQHIGFNKNQSAPYDDFQVDAFFSTCGYYAPYGQVHIQVTTVFLNEPSFQNQSAYYFTFDNAYTYYTQTGLGCYVTEPAIQAGVAVSENATARALERSYRPFGYMPTVATGEGDLCFSYAAQFTPEFIIDFNNGSMITLHPNSYQTYSLAVSQIPQTLSQSNSAGGSVYVTPSRSIIGVVGDFVTVVEFGGIVFSAFALAFPDEIDRLKHRLSRDQRQQDANEEETNDIQYYCYA